MRDANNSNPLNVKSLRIYGVLFEKSGTLDGFIVIGKGGLKLANKPGGVKNEIRDFTNSIWHIPRAKIIDYGCVDSLTREGYQIYWFDLHHDTKVIEERYTPFSISVLLQKATSIHYMQAHQTTTNNDYPYPSVTYNDAEIPPTNEDLVEAVVREGVRNVSVLKALLAVPRAGFVPPSLAERAYLDEPLPLPHDLVTTQPSLIAKIVEALELTGSERVLEIGTGYGYQTALLAHLAPFVWSVERWPDLAETARANLARHWIFNVEIVIGDGTEGLPQHAPFDAIIVSAAYPHVSPRLNEQLAQGGRLVQPIGSDREDDVILFEKGSQGLMRRQTVRRARFVPLYGKFGFSPRAD